MNAQSITQLYDTYKTYRQYEKKAKAVKRNFDMTVQGITSTHTFTKHGDAESLHKMIEAMNFFIGKNPIGKAMVKFYEPHFKMLEIVWGAVKANDNELTKALDDLEKEITNFINSAPSVKNATEFNKSELQQGPISYSLYLVTKENAVENAETRQMILGFVNLIKGRSEAIVYELDRLLTYYDNLGQNYQKLYNEGMALYKTNQEKGGLTKVFADKAEGLRWLTYEQDFGTFRSLVNDLKKNRNAWADWLGVPQKTEFK